MNITIIGPLCSGKSTFALDLKKRIKDSIVYEEAHRTLANEGTLLPVGEKTTEESATTLFNFSERIVNGLESSKINIVLGSPFDEFMYAVNAMNLTQGKVINKDFLDTLKVRAQKAMKSFDIVLKIEDFQNIPFQSDGVRPDKDKDYRDTVNNIIDDLIQNDNKWAVLDSDTIKKIKVVSGNRNERVDLALKYLIDVGLKKENIIEITVQNHGLFSFSDKVEENELAHDVSYTKNF